MSCSNNIPPLQPAKCNEKALRRLDELAVAKLQAQLKDPSYHPPTPWMLDFANGRRPR